MITSIPNLYRFFYVFLFLLQNKQFINSFHKKNFFKWENGDFLFIVLAIVFGVLQTLLSKKQFPLLQKFKNSMFISHHRFYRWLSQACEQLFSMGTQSILMNISHAEITSRGCLQTAVMLSCCCSFLFPINNDSTYSAPRQL